jgi:hypothetical protein
MSALSLVGAPKAHRVEPPEEGVDMDVYNKVLAISMSLNAAFFLIGVGVGYLVWGGKTDDKG